MYLTNAVLCTSLPRFMCMKQIYEITKRIYAKHTRMHVIEVNLSLRYSSIKVNVTYKFQTAHVQRRVSPNGFRWSVRNRLFNGHDKALEGGQGGCKLFCVCTFRGTGT